MTHHDHRNTRSRCIGTSDHDGRNTHLGETTEAFLDGHVAAFQWLRGVPRSILYDNTPLAVAKIGADGMRKRTRAFSELVSHYLFEDRFGRPGKGNDKDQASYCTSLDIFDVS